MRMPKYDFNLTVDPNYWGEYLDALGMKFALEEMGERVKLTELPVTRIIKHPVIVPEGVVHNINFHTCYHPCQDANHNHLFFHEVHDIEDIGDVPWEDFFRYDTIFTPAKEFAKKFGINHLQMAVDPTVFNKEKSILKIDERIFEADVCFIGNNHKHRKREAIDDYIMPLVEEGYKVRVWGNGWDDLPIEIAPQIKIPLRYAKRIYQNSKVGLNFVVGGMEKWGLGTNRLYQMGACGIAAVSYPCKDYLSGYGTTEDKVAWAMTPEEFVEKTIKLLKSDKKRENIAKKFYEHTMNHHTWFNRLNDIFPMLHTPCRDFENIYPYDQVRTYDTDLLIGIPGEPLGDQFAVGLMHSIIMGRPRFEFETYIPKRSFAIDKARNDICGQFLQGGHRILLMIDNDLRLKPEVIELLIHDMVSRDLDIVCGWYPRWDPKTKTAYPHFYVDDGEGNGIQPAPTFKNDNLIRAKTVPTGCMMIQRRVIEEMYSNGIMPFLDTHMLHPKFYQALESTNQMSEDTWFCRKAEELGFEIWVDPRAECSHLKGVRLNREGFQVI